jgi:hypothetical protein
MVGIVLNSTLQLHFLIEENKRLLFFANDSKKNALTLYSTYLQNISYTLLKKS